MLSRLAAIGIGVIAVIVAYSHLHTAATWVDLATYSGDTALVQSYYIQSSFEVLIGIAFLLFAIVVQAIAIVLLMPVSQVTNSEKPLYKKPLGPMKPLGSLPPLDHE